MRLIVGLGNPGERYAGTRHNVGVMVLERASARWKIELSVMGRVRRGYGRVGTIDVILAQPLAWMNQNGSVVQALLDESGSSPHDVIVVHDDLDLPAGRLRLKRSGGSGGHNGILSLLTVLGTNQFSRLKIGIGRPVGGEETADYVLSPFTPDETAIIDATLGRAVFALECLLLEGVEVAMNRFHVRDHEGEQ
ncbi:MAG: aminoacyl-tRNA hydrolase [Nitrospiraceae bacterium]